MYESGNRWLQGFHAFQALGRFATSVHRLEPPDEPSLQSSAWRPNDCLKMPFSAAVGTFATRGSPGIGITGSPLNTTLDEIYLTDSLDHKV